MRSRRWGPLIGAALALLLTCAVEAPAQMAPCEAAPAVKQALKIVSDKDLSRDAEVAAYGDLLKRYPRDLFIHQRYQDAAKYPMPKEWNAVIDEYRGLAKAHPSDPLFEYLALRAAIGNGTKDLLPALERVSGRVPAAHLSLVQVYQSTAFKDAAKARDHLDAFMAACPATLTPFQYLRSIDTSDFVKASTTRMRQILAKRTDLDAARWYPTLWSLEFRIRPVSEHDQLRKQVAEDVNRLRALNGTDATFLSALQTGYKQAGDADGEKWATGELAKLSYYATKALWTKDHPYPKVTDSPEVTQAYYQAHAKASLEWVRKWPNDVMAWFDWVSVLISAKAADRGDVLKAGEGLLDIVAKKPDSMSFGSPIGGTSFSLMVAYLYATHGVAQDRLPELVAQGITDNDAPRAGSVGLDSDLYPRPAPPSGASESSFPWYGRLTAADVWIKVRDTARARKTLLDIQARVEAAKPTTDPKDTTYVGKQRSYLSRQADYWQRMGDVAAIEGHKTDAMTFYQNAVFARPAAPAAGAKDELGEKARALWTELGGSNEGWQAWFTRRDFLGGASATGAAAALTWTPMEKTLPAFELTDLRGATLRLPDFKGKATLVGIWATW
jgi:hypothetical protein